MRGVGRMENRRNNKWGGGYQEKRRMKEECSKSTKRGGLTRGGWHQENYERVLEEGGRGDVSTEKEKDERWQEGTMREVQRKKDGRP